MARLSTFLIRRWKLVLNILTLVALVALVIGIRGQLGQTFENLFRVHAWLLLLMLPVEYLNYDAQARLYQRLFLMTGNRLRYWPLVKASVELNFVNHVFPSGGVTGISYWGVRMRQKDITGAKATVVHLMKLVLLFLSFEALLVIGLLFLAADGQINNVILLVAGSLTTLLVVGTAGFAFIIGSRQRISGFFTYLTMLLNRLIRTIRPGKHDPINIERARAVFDDLHENYVLVSRDWRQLKWPFVWAFAANFWEIMALYVVYLAFGDAVNLGAIIIAYGVANFAGLVSILPGGVGIYEGLMTLVLAAAGIPSRLSLPVTVMYRILNTLVQLPPGWWLYHRALNAPASDKSTA